MATPYNHKEIEKKWRDNWAANPVNVNDGKILSITVWICSHILLVVVFM